MTQAEYHAFIQDSVQRIVRHFDPDRIILFGSGASGRTTPDSDVDILVVMPVTGSERKKAGEIDLLLADRIVPMDVIVVTPEQFERQKNLIGTIVREAAREGKVLYERAA